MESAGSVVGMVDGVAPNIAGVHGSCDVGMYRVSKRKYFSFKLLGNIKNVYLLTLKA